MPELSGSTYSETDASNSAAAPNGMPEGMAPSGVNDSWRAGMGAIQRWWNRMNGRYASTGTTPNYVLTPTVALAAYVTGERYSFRANFTCGASPTLNISALGAKNIKKFVNGTTKANLAANDIMNGQAVTVEYDGTDMLMVTPTAGLADAASANTFTATQTIQSTDAGAAVGPLLVLDRDSASPAASDVIGGVDFLGEDSAGNDETYARIQGVIVDPTSTSEDAQIQVLTDVAGTLAARVTIGQGVQIGSPTGGDKGTGTINATAIYDDNVQIVIPTYALYQNQQTSGTSGPTYTSGAWRTIPLNTEVYDASAIGSIASNQITLGAGTYEVYASHSYNPGDSSDQALRLQDVTNTVTLLRGVNQGYTGSGAGGHTKSPALFGIFTLAGSAAVELQIFPDVNTVAQTGASSGSVEVYATVHIVKVA